MSNAQGKFSKLEKKDIGTAAPVRFNFIVAAYLCLIHVAAAAAFFPPVRLSYVALAIFTYLFVGFCTTIGLRRLLSHRSFRRAKWLEYLLVTGAMLTGQGSPLLRVANRRVHHRESDLAGDVHSPRRGFWYSHFGWIVDDSSTVPLAYRKYCKDLAGDRCHHWLVRYRLAPQLVAVLALGEGWHNNHHASPRSVRHGMRWNQIDFSYLVVRLLAAAGLAWSLHEPKAAAVKKHVREGDALCTPN